jgi:coenzyme F420-reducing hydrogenase beta subunit
MKTYFVDTVHHHKLFENLAKEFGVDQISPKILIIEKGKCVFDAINGKAQVINLKQFAN